MDDPLSGQSLLFERHEPSAKRYAKKIFVTLALCGLVYTCFDCYRQEVDKPLPPGITDLQRKNAKAIEKRFSLATWTWSTDGKAVDLYDPAVKGWRKVQ